MQSSAAHSEKKYLARFQNSKDSPDIVRTHTQYFADLHKTQYNTNTTQGKKCVHTNIQTHKHEKKNNKLKIIIFCTVVLNKEN